MSEGPELTARIFLTPKALKEKPKILKGHANLASSVQTCVRIMLWSPASGQK